VTTVEMAFLVLAAVSVSVVVTLLVCGGIAYRDTQVPRDPRDGDASP